MKKILFLMLFLGSFIAADRIDFNDYLLVKNNIKAPDFSLYDLKGKKHSLSDNQNKKIVLINFFATYCEPCKLELPGFAKLYEKYKDKIEIFSISLEKDNKKIADFSNEYKLNFPVFMDYTRSCVNKYLKNGSLAALPTNILIGKDGNILEITNSLEEKLLENWILKYSIEDKGSKMAVEQEK